MKLTTFVCSCVAIMAVSLIAVPRIAHAGGVPEGDNAVNADLGFSRGGADLGLDYEYGYARTYSVGGYLRVIPDSTSSNQNGVTTFGVFVRPHFSRGNWDFYVSPGFGLVSEKYVQGNNTNTYTMLGPSFAVGLMYDLTPNMAVGAEQMDIYGWFNSTAGGDINQDLTAKFRYIF